MRAKDRIFIAADVPNFAELKALVETIGSGYNIKVGMELLYAEGARVIDYLNDQGMNVFADAKLHDIPETMGRTAKMIAKHKPVFLNCHAAAGVEGMRRVAEVCAEAGVSSLAVTVLTSHDQIACANIFGNNVGRKVEDFAFDALSAGVSGVVCSPQDLATLSCLDEDLATLVKMTPGVRPLWAETDDQKRVMTPSEAVAAGADYLVIGRPITNPPPEIGGPKMALEAILTELNGQRTILQRDARGKMREIVFTEQE